MAERLLQFPVRISEEDVRLEKLFYRLCPKYKATEETPSFAPALIPFTLSRSRSIWLTVFYLGFQSRRLEDCG
jgi:hypothetical protein